MATLPGARDALETHLTVNPSATSTTTRRRAVPGKAALLPMFVAGALRLTQCSGAQMQPTEFSLLTLQAEGKNEGALGA